MGRHLQEEIAGRDGVGRADQTTDRVDELIGEVSPIQTAEISIVSDKHDEHAGEAEFEVVRWVSKWRRARSRWRRRARPARTNRIDRGGRRKNSFAVEPNRSAAAR